MITVLFGKAGSGKSHIGRMASLAYGLYFHDADDDLPERFRQAVARREKVTDEMREEYLEAMIAAAKRLMTDHRNLCICQALPRNRIRERILRAIPTAEFVWVDAPSELISSRLRARPGHVASVEYAETVNRIFEIPIVPHVKLVNGNDITKLRRQMNAIFGRNPDGHASLLDQPVERRAILGETGSLQSAS
jgi:carbohydrate kinase (thermoresistant glucokinase family)